MFTTKVIVFAGQNVLIEKEKKELWRTMFSDDFDEFRARSYSGGFMTFDNDCHSKRSTSVSKTCRHCESTATIDSYGAAGTDVMLSEKNAHLSRVCDRRHSDEMVAYTYNTWLL